MGYLVRTYYSISPTKYYKDNSCWSAELKSNTTEDVISIGSFMEVLVLNHYVLVRNILITIVYHSLIHLNAQLQEKVFAITALKEELRKLKGESVIACRESVNMPKVIAPVVHKVDLEPLSLKLKDNREAHVDYIRITKENADTLLDIVEQPRTSNPLDNTLAYACVYTK
ncbi:hypothetical protein Tco_0024769 [Tanacetum coccineum]